MSTGPPSKNVDAVGFHPHGAKGDDVNSVLASENARFRLGGQAHRYSIGLVPLRWQAKIQEGLCR